MKEPTSTSYAVLGLLAAGPQTAYELARQVARGLRFVWPRAEGRIYDEPRLLADHGLALARQEYTGRRPRTVYSITPKGRRALRRWVAEPGAGPALEYETLLKVAFAGCATKADLLGHLHAIGGHAAARLATGRARADEYANARVPLPEHLAVNGLMWNFLWQFYSAVEDWAAWAAAEVSRWPDDLRSTAGPDARAMEMFRAALDTPRGQPGALPG
ncbi:MAG: PadR family transcriptional regulator [Streptosporangiaceae bacterium]